jgi:hypothetical protein
MISSNNKQKIAFLEKPEVQTIKLSNEALAQHNKIISLT